VSTIFALATASGAAAIAIVRISGPETSTVLAALNGAVPALDRVARRRLLRHPQTGEPLDDALVIGFPAGGGYTGEPSAELHVHGGPATVRAILAALGDVDGARLAKPGEFTRRALENGRLDLTQAEAIADLVAAETDHQRLLALRGADGAVSRLIAEWRTRLNRAMALIEAAIDFPDEDVGDDPTGPAHGEIALLIDAIGREIGHAPAAQRLRSGFTVAILGAPNAGKSTLINAIAARDVALTSDIPGTTRDVIEAPCILRGRAVVFLDTAGLRETQDPIERLGQAAARARATEADLRIFLVTDDAAPPDTAWSPGDVWLRNKIDAGAGAAVGVSALTGEGLDWLLNLVATRAETDDANAATTLRDRHVVSLRAAIVHLEATCGAEPEIAAEELRLAAQALDSVLGKIDVEDVLDEVFSAFCIGK
jgi:tRNA modification GTPase